jgi:hypothetical protein
MKSVKSVITFVSTVMAGRTALSRLRRGEDEA